MRYNDGGHFLFINMMSCHYNDNDNDKYYYSVATSCRYTGSNGDSREHYYSGFPDPSLAGGCCLAWRMILEINVRLGRGR